MRDRENLISCSNSKFANLHMCMDIHPADDACDAQSDDYPFNDLVEQVITRYELR